MKDKEANRFAPKTPDEVSRSGTGKNAKVDGQEGNKKEKPPYKKRQQRISRLKSPAKREKKPKTLKEAIQTHYWVIWWLIPQQVQKKGKKIKLA